MLATRKHNSPAAAALAQLDRTLGCSVAKHAADAALVAEARCIRCSVLVMPATSKACCATAFFSGMTKLATAVAVKACAAVSSVMADVSTDTAHRLAIVHIWSHLACWVSDHDAACLSTESVLCYCCYRCCSCKAGG